MSLTTKVNGNSVPVIAIRHNDTREHLYVTAVTLSQLGFSDKAGLVLSAGEIINAALEEKLEPINLESYGWEWLPASLFTAFTHSEGLILLSGLLGCLSISHSTLISHQSAFFLNSEKLPRNRFIFIVDPDRVEGRQEE